MKRLILALTFIFSTFDPYAQTVCSSEKLFNLGDQHKLSHTYYDPSTNSVFGVGYFTDTVTVGTTQYIADPGYTGKYIVEMDTAGALLNSFQTMSTTNHLESPGGSGYFEPGIGIAIDYLIVPLVYQDAAGEYIFEVQALDKKSGALMWQNVMQGGLAVGQNFGFDMIKIDPFGNIVLTGVFYDGLTIERVLHSSGAVSTGFVMLLNANGTFKSMTKITGSERMELFGLTTDDAGNLYVSGNVHNAETITVEGTPITYTGINSAFLIKLDAKGTYQWAHIFESTGGPEPKAILYDKVNDLIHYVSTDYESLDKGSKLGALNALDGSVNWEKTMVVPNWYYISYSSWIDYNDLSIYYSVWGKRGSDQETSLSMDGAVVKDRINTNTYFHKFSLKGRSQYISPSRFTSIGEVAKVSATNIFMQANYQRSRNLQGNTLAIINPKNYPAPFAYIEKEGVYVSDNVTFYASSDVAGVTYQWLQYGEYLTGETNPSYSPTMPGVYHAEISDGKNCPVKTRSYTVESQPTLELDSLALVDLYNATNGKSWTNNTNWLVGMVDTWYGITVDSARITEIFLANNNMNGRMPESIDNLTGLKQLYIDANNISGTLPPSFWSLKKLVNINLHDNPNLGWEIHPNVGNLYALESIRAFNTNLKGIIPPEIGNVTTLKELWLSNTNLTGVIPPALGSLPALLKLELSSNPFNKDSSIPVEIGNITSLQSFNVANCQLAGKIPNEVWQLPNLQLLSAHSNPRLDINLPANLETLTQFQHLQFAKTKPLATAFPEDLYSLTNLVTLNFAGHRLTGSLDSRVANWKNLDNLWLWDNNLEGELPAEIASLPLLQAAGFDYNKLTGLPTFDPKVLQTLEVAGNYLGFDDIVRNQNIISFDYSPQRNRPVINKTIDEGASLDLINSYDTPGNVYSWTLNRFTKLGTNMNHTISNAGLADLGKYSCAITNPDVPGLTLEANFNIAFSGPPRSFTVDNSPGSLADFKSFFAASYGTNDNDTLYIGGSIYEDFVIFESPRVLYGPGYFLAQNPETQASPQPAQISGVYFNMGSGGSAVYGLELSRMMINNQASYLNDTIYDIIVSGNKIIELSLNDDCKNILIDKNYLGTFSFASTPVADVSRSYQDITIENNIIGNVTTIFAKATAAKNEMVNVVFDRNTIKVFTDSIQDATVSNNFIDDYQATGNTVSYNYDFTAAAFQNSSGQMNIDNDYISTGTVDAGAFSGTDPYKLSGLPQAPHLYALTNTGRIRINAQGKAETGATITALGYRIGQRGTITDQGIVTKLEPGNPIDVLFRPRLGKVTPGGIYDLMLWAEDDSGKKSIHQTLTFTAETTSASGTIYTSNDLPVTAGDVLLFEINQEGTAFDTLSAPLNDLGGFNFSNIVVGDYLALGRADTTSFPEQLPTYYSRIDLWEAADTLLLDVNNTNFDIKLIVEPKHELGEGKITGFIEEEFEVADDQYGRVAKAVRERVSRTGVSVRRAVRNARSSEVVYELVAFLYTDENGEFDFSDLPPDTYRINFQYPGYPMDPNSNLDITLGDKLNDNYTVQALVAKGKISVTVAAVTGLMEEVIKTIKVYPNPTTAEHITVAFLDDTGLQGKVDLQLFDISGNMIIHKTVEAKDLKHNSEVRIPINGFQKGTYLLKLYQSKEELGTVRLIVH